MLTSQAFAITVFMFALHGETQAWEQKNNGVSNGLGNNECISCGVGNGRNNDDGAASVDSWKIDWRHMDDINPSKFLQPSTPTKFVEKPDPATPGQQHAVLPSTDMRLSTETPVHPAVQRFVYSATQVPRFVPQPTAPQTPLLATAPPATAPPATPPPATAAPATAPPATAPPATAPPATAPPATYHIAVQETLSNRVTKTPVYIVPALATAGPTAQQYSTSGINVTPVVAKNYEAPSKGGVSVTTEVIDGVTVRCCHGAGNAITFTAFPDSDCSFSMNDGKPKTLKAMIKMTCARGTVFDLAICGCNYKTRVNIASCSSSEL